MKLQLDEQTLNAYINEAIRQELNEGPFSGPEEETNITFKVHFGALGTPEAKANKPQREWSQGSWKDDLTDWTGEFGDEVQNTFRSIWNGQGINPKTQLERGSFGYNNKAIMPDIQKKHNKKTRLALIAALRQLGYSDRQIGAALKYGKIEAGHYIANEFVPLSNQTTELKNVALSVDKRRSLLYSWYLGAREEDMAPIEYFGNEDQEQDDGIQDDGEDIIDNNEQDMVDGGGQEESGNTIEPQEAEREFPWDNYPYESFPWDDYLARPTPRTNSRGQDSVEKSQPQEQQPQVQSGQKEIVSTGDANTAQTRPSFDAISKVKQPQMPKTVDAPETKIEIPKAQATHPGNVITAMHNFAKEDPSKMSNREKTKVINNTANSAIKATRNDSYAGGDKNKQQQSRDAIRMARNNILRGDNSPNI